MGDGLKDLFREIEMEAKYRRLHYIQLADRPCPDCPYRSQEQPTERGLSERARAIKGSPVNC